VLRAGLTWRQAMVLRAYAKYLRQGGTTFSQRYIEECLTLEHPPRAAAGGAVRGAVRPVPNAPGGSAPRSWSTG
jgi:glutamate dehydrogenase